VGGGGGGGGGVSGSSNQVDTCQKIWNGNMRNKLYRFKIFTSGYLQVSHISVTVMEVSLWTQHRAYLSSAKLLSTYSISLLTQSQSKQSRRKTNTNTDVQHHTLLLKHIFRIREVSKQRSFVLSFNY
jgi:hypothetical protein